MQEIPVPFLGRENPLEKGQSIHPSILGLPLVAQLVKNPPAMWETSVRSPGWKDSLEKGRLPILVFWPGEFPGLYSLWGGHKESDMTERLSLSISIKRVNLFNFEDNLNQNILDIRFIILFIQGEKYSVFTMITKKKKEKNTLEETSKLNAYELPIQSGHLENFSLFTLCGNQVILKFAL